MKVIKTVRQDTTQAFETIYIIKGVFKKRIYRLDITQLVEIETLKLHHEK